MRYSQAKVERDQLFDRNTSTEIVNIMYIAVIYNNDRSYEDHGL